MSEIIVDRFAPHFRLHGIGNETLGMCLVMHFIHFRRGGSWVTGELNMRPQTHRRYGHSAFAILAHLTNGGVEVTINTEASPSRDGKKPEHVAARQ